MSPSHHHHRILTVTIIALAALLCPASSNADDYVSRVWVADQGDGTYINPIIHAVEGPKFYKRNGYYYILAPAGGVDKGWQIALRSRSPFGPYEMRRVMEQGDTDINGPHQGGLVDTNSGQSWFIHFQDKGLYGRVLHLNPVTWVDDWPVIGSDSDNDGCGNPVSRYSKPDVGRTYPVTTPAESDDFNSTRLGLQWEWHANYQPEFGFPTPYGYMRVYGHELSENFVSLWEVPNLLLQKFPAEEFTVTAKVKISSKADGQQSGLIVMGHDYCTLGLEKNGEKFDLVQTVCHDAEQGGAETRTLVTDMSPSRRYEAGLHPNYERDIYLRVRMDKGGKCTFSYSLDGLKFIDTKIPFTARQGKWIGAKTGIFSIQPNGVDRGWIDIDSFIIDRN